MLKCFSCPRAAHVHCRDLLSSDCREVLNNQCKTKLVKCLAVSPPRHTPQIYWHGGIHESLTGRRCSRPGWNYHIIFPHIWLHFRLRDTSYPPQNPTHDASAVTGVTRGGTIISQLCGDCCNVAMCHVANISTWAHLVGPLYMCLLIFQKSNLFCISHTRYPLWLAGDLNINLNVLG